MGTLADVDRLLAADRTIAEHADPQETPRARRRVRGTGRRAGCRPGRAAARLAGDGQPAATRGDDRGRTQTIHDRVRAHELLAVDDQGHLRPPAWPFDPTGPNGTLLGLPEVLRELAGRPLGELARVLWFTSPKPSLQDRSPAVALADGDLHHTLGEARTIAV